MRVEGGDGGDAFNQEKERKRQEVYWVGRACYADRISEWEAFYPRNPPWV